jgi:hypothetical protein
MRNRLGSVLQAVGMVVVSVGLAMWQLEVGVITAGVGLLGFGLAIETARGR